MGSLHSTNTLEVDTFAKVRFVGGDGAVGTGEST